MCGRYTNTAGPEELGERFGVHLESPAGTGRYNICPGQQVLVVALAQGGREARLVRWGLRPHWQKGTKRSYALINARSEGVLHSRTYRPLIASARHRVLALADGWYEWLHAEQRTERPTPFRLTVDGGKPFAIAALANSDGIGEQGTQGVALLTCAAPPPLASLHHRMPVVLADSPLQEAWLSEDVGAEEAAALCHALAAERVSIGPANRRLNAPGAAEGPDLLLPDPTPPPA